MDKGNTVMGRHLGRLLESPMDLVTVKHLTVKVLK